MMIIRTINVRFAERHTVTDLQVFNSLNIDYKLELHNFTITNIIILSRTYFNRTTVVDIPLEPRSLFHFLILDLLLANSKNYNIVNKVGVENTITLLII